MISDGDKKLFFYPNKSNALIFLLNGITVITDPRNTDTFFVQDITLYIEHYQNIFLSNINQDSPKDSLEVFLSAIFALLMNTINVMIEFIESLRNQKSNSEDTSYSFYTPLITDKHEVILVFSKSRRKDSTKIDKILIEILNQCKQKAGKVNRLIEPFVNDLTSFITNQFKDHQNKSFTYKNKLILNFFNGFKQSLVGFSQDFNNKHNINISSNLKFTPNFYWLDLFYFINCIYCKDRSFIKLSQTIVMIDNIFKFPNYEENSKDLKPFLRDIISTKIEKIPAQDKLSYFDYFIKELSKTFFNSTFYEQLNEDSRNDYLIRDLQKLDGCSYQFVFDHKRFYIQLTCKESQNQANTLNCDSKFILQSDNSKRNNISNQYFFSFMPIGSLEKFFLINQSSQEIIFKDKSIQLADFNKYVIILEIANALKKLHSEGQFCGNLSLNSIFINSQLDAYICSTKGSVNNDITAFISVFSQLFNDSDDDNIKEIIRSSSNLTITKIIRKIKRLKFYIENKNDIDYRISHSIDYREQTCTFNDLFESYFRFPDVFKNDVSQSLNLIKQFNNNIDSTVERTLDIMQKFTYLSDLVQSLQYRIYDNMNPVPEIINLDNSDDLWLKLINCKSFTNTKEILDTLESIYNFYKEDENKKKQIKKAIMEFISTYRCNTAIYEGNLRYELIKIFTEILKNGTFVNLNTLFTILIKNLLDKSVYSHRIETFSIDDTEPFNLNDDANQIFTERAKTLHFGSDHNFFLGYPITNTDENLREIRIFEKNISKFIPMIVNKSARKYFIPFFPIGSLKNMITNDQISNEMKIKFGLVDRIVNILQILNGVNDLHISKEFHGNLCDQAIFINSNRDAYIGWIGYDTNDANLTKNRGPRFYRSISSHKRYENKEKNVFSNERIHDDIFSCAILIFEILADKTPYDIIHEKIRDRNEINELIKSEDYLKFLLKTEYGENISTEFKELIERCSLSHKKHFNSVIEMINYIKELHFYKKNVTEIAYRINHAIDYRKNGCDLSDLVQCCLLGFKYNQTHIRKMLNHVYYNQNLKFDFKSNCMINDIYDFLDLKRKSYKIEKFDETFSSLIISNFLEKEIKSINQFDFSNHFHLTAMKINVDNIPIPFCSADIFIKNNQNLFLRFRHSWPYIIAKELYQIHNDKNYNNWYHGNLSLNSIGIYYNRKLQMFIPSIICYYPIFMKNKNILNSKKQNLDQSFQQNLAKMQSDDIKNYYKIVEEFGKDFSYVKDIKNNEMKLIEILSYLNSNSFFNNLNAEQKYDFKCYKNYELNNDYSDLKINYTDIRQLRSLDNCICSFNGSFIDFHSLEL